MAWIRERLVIDIIAVLVLHAVSWALALLVWLQFGHM